MTHQQVNGRVFGQLQQYAYEISWSKKKCSMIDNSILLIPIFRFIFDIDQNDQKNIHCCLSVNNQLNNTMVVIQLYRNKCGWNLAQSSVSRKMFISVCLLTKA